MNIGTKVRTRTGCRMEGQVINRTPTPEQFALCGGSLRTPPWTDGTYRWPYPHEKVVWVFWTDGTYGWTYRQNLEIVA